MKMIVRKIREADWQQIAVNLNENGYAVLSGLLSATQCKALIDEYSSENSYRKTVIMMR